jgi:leader peptidase (prepilin peptidase)/N-methyltransferase
MNAALAAFAVAPALLLGSFLNVVAARLPEGLSLARLPSACPACPTGTGWRDSVAVLSYSLLGGRCRRCGERIGARFVVVELLTALFVAACFLRFGLSGDAFVAAFFVCALVVLSAIDVERRILPDKIVLPSAAVVLAANVALAPERWVEWTVAPLGASLFLFAAALLYPRGMGMGDVKLCLLLGAALGKLVLVALVAGMSSALLPAVVLFARHGTAGRKVGIPFGPFLAVGAVVALFWGDALLEAYMSTL